MQRLLLVSQRREAAQHRDRSENRAQDSEKAEGERTQRPEDEVGMLAKVAEEQRGDGRLRAVRRERGPLQRGYDLEDGEFRKQAMVGIWPRSNAAAIMREGRIGIVSPPLS